MGLEVQGETKEGDTMKVSDLIKQLVTAMKNHGDLEVCVSGLYCSRDTNVKVERKTINEYGENHIWISTELCTG